MFFLFHNRISYSFTICSRLDLTAPTRYMGARHLLKEGILMKAKSGKKLHAFLCSDILVLTDDKVQNLYRMVGGDDSPMATQF